MGQKAQPGQEDRHRVQPPQGRAQGEPPAPQGLPRQPGRGQQEEVVHQSVEEEQRVYIDNGHVSPPFGTSYYRSLAGRKQSESW